MPAPSLTPADVATFQRSFNRAVAVMRRFLVSLTPREKLILQLGLRASHLEEAMAAGDQERAAAHAKGLVTIAQALAASHGDSST
jgi:hypothetical protein